MSLGLSLQTALSGLQINQAALSTTSNNVANANTPGYTRKQVEPVTRTLVGKGVGVELGALSRAVDERLIREIREANSTLGTVSVKGSYLDRIQDLFGKPADNSSLANRLDQLGAAMANLSVTPESETERLNLINEAQRVSQQLRDMSSEMQDLRLEADQEIAQAVSVINEQLQAIARLNGEISQLQGMNQPTAELEDQRDRAIDKISQYMEISYFTRTTGETVLYTADGTVLADNVAKSLSHNAASTMGPLVTYGGGGIDSIDVGTVDLTPLLQEGELAGLIQLRDTELPNMQSELDRMTQMLRDQVNAIHNRGTGLPASNTLTGQRAFAAPATDSVTLTADVQFSVIDGDGVVQATHTLAAGTYSINALMADVNGGLGGAATMSITAEGTVEFDAANAAHGVALADTGDIGDQDITFDDGTPTAYADTGLSHFLGLNDFFTTGSTVFDPNPATLQTGVAQTLQVRSDIAARPELISRGQLSTTAAVGEVGIGAGDNRVITQLAEMFDNELEVPAAGSLSVSRTTLSGYGADILSNAAIKADVTADNKAFRETLSQELDYRRSSVSGVNIDEEMANLVLYQNAYTASARVMDTTRQMFETLEALLR
jgi:flagellar hook-associated protein 1 FlgK